MPRLSTIDPTIDTGEGVDLLNGALKEKQLNIFKGLAAHPSVLRSFLAWSQESKGGALTLAQLRSKLHRSQWPQQHKR